MALSRSAVIVMVVGMLTASLVTASTAHAGSCGGQRSAVLQASQWLQTDYSYTDRSWWLGDSLKGYTAERISTGGVTYFHDMPNGGEHNFDNGSTSPWRKTSFYNWYSNSNWAHVEQFNDSGSCT